MFGHWADLAAGELQERRNAERGHERGQVCPSCYSQRVGGQYAAGRAVWQCLTCGFTWKAEP